MNRVLVIVAHPDDEVLGVGGVTQKHQQKGDIVDCLILGEGITSRNSSVCGGSIKNQINNLQKQSKEAAKLIRIREPYFTKLPDNRLDTIPLIDIIKHIEYFIGKLKPDIIYTHHSGDVNIDHQVVYQAVLTACRPCNLTKSLKIYTFEVLSSTEWQYERNKQFTPNTFIELDESHIKNKCDALKLYKKEIRDYPHPRSVEGIELLAKNRGMQAGVLFAEAFILEREIIKRCKL